MQDLNPAFIVKLCAIPQPILATIALMAELHNPVPTNPGEQLVGDCVDVEHLVGEHPYYRSRSTTEE